MATLSGYMVFEQADKFQYSINFSGSVTTADRVLAQLQFTAAMLGELVEVGVDGQSDTADAMEILICRMTAVATGGTSVTPLELTEAGPPSTTTNATNGTGNLFTAATGTQGDILVRRDASVQAGGGFFWSRNMGGVRILVPVSGIIAVKSNIAIT